MVFAFDLGNVLFDFDYNISLDKLVGRMKASKQDILDLVSANEYGMDFERGKLTTKEFYQGFVKRFDAEIEYKDFCTIWADIFKLKPEMVDFVKEIKEKHSVFMISNINELHFEFLYSNFNEVFDLFDGLILSYKVKAVKPDIEIYQALAKAANAEFNQIIYIDDRKDLTDPASSYGLKAVLFTDLTKLKTDIKRLLP